MLFSCQKSQLYSSNILTFAPWWQRSQRIMDNVWQRCGQDGIDVTVVNGPYLNLLGYYSLFDQVNGRIGEYFGSKSVNYINGVDCFLGRIGESFSVSRYDGHPNEVAHQILAAETSRKILEQTQTPD